MPALALVAALLALVATSPARADDWVSGGAALPTRIPDLPLTQAEVENRTRFHLTARWTPASAAHLWQVDLFLAARITPHLALTFGVPLAVLAPQGPFLPGQDGADRFALGNVRDGTALVAQEISRHRHPPGCEVLHGRDPHGGGEVLEERGP